MLFDPEDEPGGLNRKPEPARNAPDWPPLVPPSPEVRELLAAYWQARQADAGGGGGR